MCRASPVPRNLLAKCLGIYGLLLFHAVYHQVLLWGVHATFPLRSTPLTNCIAKLNISYQSILFPSFSSLSLENIYINTSNICLRFRLRYYFTSTRLLHRWCRKWCLCQSFTHYKRNLLKFWGLYFMNTRFLFLWGAPAYNSKFSSRRWHVPLKHWPKLTSIQTKILWTLNPVWSLKQRPGALFKLSLLQ